MLVDATIKNLDGVVGLVVPLHREKGNLEGASTANGGVVSSLVFLGD
jgi:hypothetical protein